MYLTMEDWSLSPDSKWGRKVVFRLSQKFDVYAILRLKWERTSTFRVHQHSSSNSNLICNHKFNWISFVKPYTWFMVYSSSSFESVASQIDLFSPKAQPEPSISRIEKKFISVLEKKIYLFSSRGQRTNNKARARRSWALGINHKGVKIRLKTLDEKKLTDRNRNINNDKV